MTVMKIILLISMLWAAYIPTKRALHIFQQNRYEIRRLNKWFLENKNDLLKKHNLPLCISVIGCVVALVCSGIVRDIVLIAILVLFGIFYFVQENKKSYIKPLVYTARVKRQIGFMVVLLILWDLVVLLYDFNPMIVCSGLLVPWMMIYPMAGMTEPIEAFFRQQFLNEAKRILQSHSNLVKVGITGSFGKTTTKNIMQAMLSEQFNSLMTPASFNTPMGITRTIREYLKPIHEVFVCEMGADKVGDITELMEFVHPSIGVVTSIGPQHLNTFGSQENITREKMQMIERLPKDGFGVLNYDNALIRDYKIQNSVEVVTYGIDEENVDYRAVNIQYTQTGSSFTVVHGKESYDFQTKLLGQLNILNILSAIAVARHLGVKWATIQRAVKGMKQVEHRLELKKINGYRFIDDAFNANPVGSAMALDVLSMMPNTRYIVTPGMIDLGKEQYAINKRFGTLMKDKVDVVLLIGQQQTQPIYDGLQESGFDMNNVIVYANVKEAFQYVYTHATVNDTILLENDLPDAFSH